MNRPADLAGSRTMPGWAYVQPGFTGVSLPVWLSELNTAVLPEDTAARNLYLGVYTQLLHRPDFIPYTTLFDRRITYTTDSVDVFEAVRTGAAPLINWDRQSGRLFGSKYTTKLAEGGDVWPGAVTQDTLDALRDLWFNRNNIPAAFTAGLLLIAYRTEALR